MALAIALGKSPEYCKQHVYDYVAENAKKTSGIYFGSVYLEQSLRNMVGEDSLSYKKIEGRYCIGTTAFFSQHRWHVSWESNEDLIQCVLCSLHIPFYCKSVKPIHGELLLDGAYGLAGVDFIHDDKTLFVGIDPHAEITRDFTVTQMVSIEIIRSYQIKLLFALNAFDKRLFLLFSFYQLLDKNAMM